MPGPASAYAALGLEPGADRAAIEEAYRRLIKRYHPDRSGGDAQRAAEINRAYFELRQPPGRVDAHVEPDGRTVRGRRSGPFHGSRRPSRRRRPNSFGPVLVVALSAVLLIESERLVGHLPRWFDWVDDLRTPALAGGRGSAVEADSSSLDGPLRQAVIAHAIGQAGSIARRGGDEELANQSRDCHQRMRARPELAQLDRCAAFDDTAAAIANRDPETDRGPFSASAVTARQMTAASLLSSDYLAIERRLDRIRTVVALTLRPPLPLPPVVVNEEEPAAAVPDGTEPAGNSN
jgi:curved DNA-binding protein CbpA